MTIAARENTVRRAGCPRTVAAKTLELGQYLACQVVQLPAGRQPSHGVHAIVAKHQLHVAIVAAPQQTAISCRDGDQLCSLRAGEQDAVRIAFCVGAGRVPVARVLGAIVIAQGRKQYWIVSAPQGRAGFGVYCGQVTLVAVKEDAVLVHAHSAAVDRLGFVARPEHALRSRIHCQQRLAVTPGVLVRSVGLSDRGPGPTGLRALATNDFVLLFLRADQRVQYALLHRHPLPRSALGYTGRDSDLIQQPAGSRVDQLTGLVVGQIQYVRRCHNRVPVNHESRLEIDLPQFRTVVGIHGHQLAQQRPLALFKRQMAKCFEYSSTGRDGHFRHRAVPGRSQELGPIGCDGQYVVGLRIVVGAMVGMRPLATAGRDGFHHALIASNPAAAWPQDAHHFGLHRFVACRGHCTTNAEDRRLFDGVSDQREWATINRAVARIWSAALPPCDDDIRQVAGQMET